MRAFHSFVTEWVGAPGAGRGGAGVAAPVAQSVDARHVVPTLAAHRDAQFRGVSELLLAQRSALAARDGAALAQVGQRCEALTARIAEQRGVLRALHTQVRINKRTFVRLFLVFVCLYCIVLY